jgi:hypothetical protein
MRVSQRFLAELLKSNFEKKLLFFVFKHFFGFK